MKYLKSFFEEHLVRQYKDPKTNLTKIVHDGIEFENIIENLLHDMFPGVIWHTTPVTNDGNKDFYTVHDQHTIWAECKNYGSPIDMKVLSPTLVMAQLNNTNEIYFFSSSQINDPTKRKICFYSQINNKKVHFIDDRVLENLLLTSQHKISFEKYMDLDIFFSSDLLIQPNIYCFALKNPFLNILDDDYIFGEPIKKIEYNDIISVQMFIINNSIEHELNVEYNIDTENADLCRFEYLSQNSRSAIKDISGQVVIKPYDVYTHSFNFRIASYQENLCLPYFNIAYTLNNDTKKLTNKNIMVSCECIGKTALYGDKNESCLEQLMSKLNSNKRLTVFLAHGKSGTGKTRLLEEIQPILTKCEYKIINFMAVGKENSLQIIKEIVYVLYNITADLLDTIYENYNYYKEDNYIDEQMRPGIKLLEALHNKNMTAAVFLNKFEEVIFEKLALGRYAIIIDNIQYYDSDLCTFINDLVLYLKNNNRKLSVALILSMNEDYLKDNNSAKEMKRLLYSLSDTNYMNIIFYPVDGFLSDKDENTEYALIFLKQLLCLKESTYDEFLKQLIDKINYNPYYIKYFAKHVMSMHGVVQYNYIGSQVLQHQKFIDLIHEFPAEIEASITTRWKFMLNECSGYPVTEENLKYILSCIHIFRSLSTAQLIKLGATEKQITMLISYSFIKEVNGKNEFDHDLIENYFEKELGDNIFCALNRQPCEDDIALYSEYPEARRLYQLTQKDLHPQQLEEIIEYATCQKISYRIFLKYHELCRNNLINSYKRFTDKAKWIQLALELCTNVRERFGGKYSNRYFDIINNSLSVFCTKRELIQISKFSELMFAIGESYQHGAEYNKVIKFYSEYLPLYDEINKDGKCHEQLISIIAFIHNRMSIAYAHISTEKAIIERDTHIESAISMSKNLKNHQYHAESLYNKASFRYYKREDESFFLNECKKSCKEVSDYNIELMTLHNLQRTIRCAFVERKRKKIPSLIEIGLNYLENGDFNQYRYFFTKFFHIAYAMYYLLEEENYDLAAKKVHASICETNTFGNDNIAYQQFLLAKIYYKQGKFDRCLREYKASYEFIKKSNIIEREFVLRSVYEDLTTKREIFSLDDLAFLEQNHKREMEKICNMAADEYLQYKQSYRAITIITSDDLKENYPSI